MDILKTRSTKKQRTEALKIKLRREVIAEGDKDQLKWYRKTSWQRRWMFTENPWYSMEMFHNQRKTGNTLVYVALLQWDGIWERLQQERWMPTFLAFRDLIWNTTYVLIYFKRLFKWLSFFFFLNHELWGFVSDLDFIVYGIRCSSWLKYLVVFGFNFSLVQKIFRVDLTWSSRFFQLKYYSNTLCSSWCIAESKGIVEKSITHYFFF